MNKTTIEWVRNPDGSTPGFSWSPITGCLGPKGNGVHCPYCYARKLAEGRLKQRYWANENLAPTPKDLRNYNIDPFYPRFWEERVTKMALYTGVGKGIFTCDMSDLFGIGIPEEWTRKVLEAIKMNPRNRFYLLTKQPQNLIKFSPFPDNCWVGVTAINQEMFNDAIWNLITIEAKVKYISFEPLLAPTVAGILDQHHNWPVMHGSILHNVIDWLIIGAQTHPTIFPKIEWVEEIVRAADRAGIPIFLKDNLLELINFVSPQTEFAFNKAGYYRQEMPWERD